MYASDRKPPKNLVYYETLAKHADLTEEEEKQLYRLRRGYKGEQLYDEVFDEIGHSNLIIFRDIWLKIGQSARQIDSLIISDNEIIINEIKHYTGTYTVEGDKWRINNINISEDPILQARQTTNKMISLCNNKGMHIPITYKVICTDEYFILNTNDEKCRKDIICRNHLKKYFRSFGNETATHRAEKIKTLVIENMIDNPMELPTIDISRIRKGFKCGKCESYEIKRELLTVNCKMCGYKETLKLHLMRTVKDYDVLLHHTHFTNKGIREILNDQLSQRTVHRYIAKYCIPVEGKAGYYKVKEEYRKF